MMSRQIKQIARFMFEIVFFRRYNQTSDLNTFKILNQKIPFTVRDLHNRRPTTPHLKIANKQIFQPKRNTSGTIPF